MLIPGQQQQLNQFPGQHQQQSSSRDTPHPGPLQGSSRGSSVPSGQQHQLWDPEDLRWQRVERAERLAELSRINNPFYRPGSIEDIEDADFHGRNPAQGASRLFTLPLPSIQSSPAESVGVRRSIFSSPLSSEPSPASSTSVLAVPLPSSPSSDKSVVRSPDMFDDM
jgi:hypothetical protein